MTKVERALIVGGGIAGMSLAISLQRASIATEIVELNPDWRVYGAGITITGPTLRAIDQLGLLERFMTEGHFSDGAVICDPDGNVIMASRIIGQPLGARIPNAGGILRPVLHRLLAQTTRASGAVVRCDVTVGGIGQMDDIVAVDFTDGTRGRFDLVVGADGIHSRLRSMVFPDAPRPALTGQGCWRAVVPRPAEIDRARVYVGGPVKAGVVPVSRDEVYLFLLQHVPGNPRMPEAEWPRLLGQQLRGFGGVLGAIRDGLDASSRINYRPLETLLMPPPWHRGRVVLIGDAAHATTPHLASGAGLAIEDALVLAELLKSEPHVEQALVKFTARRFERCRMVVDNSARLGELEMARASPHQQAELARESMLELNAPI
jgi:2-polyprenyl-6-methoxyphenol hydroxylase-like FAD-dependent oxidoreductase